ncbi:short chain dehydrogenase domain-containing protein [Trichoderma breve]|uniref:Short chain dehydrogenase domain-containing protein n=1 Tax=Trichoderma breve TaxID=2034170 RepID=A0A9W9BA33_9HYPO|nr:short chain dehydrogenase domain-containing protein [Trichoderma breve]KAJ4859433.1 short chain dehydrogenase domain-containing protein [Trichoderma breve]
MYSSRIFASIGAVTVAALAINVLSAVKVYILPSKLKRYAHVSADGKHPWALVTGASDGIGRAFAEELALRGFNIVLHGRNQTKLDMGGENESQHPLDFNAIKDALQDLHLTVLINNAGGGARDPVYLSLSDSSEERITDNVTVNALFPLHLIRVLLPHLAQNSPALIMNISSLADAGLPLLASYSASKQFLMTLTRTIDLEIAFSGKAEIECLGVRVGNVTGVSHNRQSPSVFTPSAETMARAALDRAGRGHGVITGHWAHALQQAMMDFMPTFLARIVILNTIRERKEAELKSS